MREHLHSARRWVGGGSSEEAVTMTSAQSVPSSAVEKHGRAFLPAQRGCTGHLGRMAVPRHAGPSESVGQLERWG